MKQSTTALPHYDILKSSYKSFYIGHAEQMNWTLVELSHAMSIANQLPEFLWEYAVLHAAYLHNWSCILLLQGQKVQWKMQPKSKCQVYIGYDDSAGAVKHYSAKMCKG